MVLALECWKERSEPGLWRHSRVRVWGTPEWAAVFGISHSKRISHWRLFIKLLIWSSLCFHKKPLSWIQPWVDAKRPVRYWRHCGLSGSHMEPAMRGWQWGWGLGTDIGCLGEMVLGFLSELRVSVEADGSSKCWFCFCLERLSGWWVRGQWRKPSNREAGDVVGACSTWGFSETPGRRIRLLIFASGAQQCGLG